ncbi:MAG: F0F1 ATP synthase subunit B [Phycisphaerales bacterium]|nr:F0F1 ATP synthase subunit B [Phycisphaerales bacterium]
MKLTRIAVAGLAVVAFAGLALAAGGEGHETVGAMPSMKQGLATGITALVVFIITAAFLSIVVWPKINSGLKDREDKIRNAIDEAEMAQEQAKAALEQYERNLAQARAEAQKMLDDAKTQQQVIAAELKAKSEIELGQLRDKARRDIEAAKAQAVVEIHAHATALATAMAGKILKREVNAGDQQRLISESLQELQTAGRA